MDTHKNARLTSKGREEMVRAVVHGGLSKAAAARKYNTTPKTVGKWVERFRTEGVNGLRDRSSKPLSSPAELQLADTTSDRRPQLRPSPLQLRRRGPPRRWSPREEIIGQPHTSRLNDLLRLSGYDAHCRDGDRGYRGIAVASTDR
jgi:transposase-like protein